MDFESRCPCGTFYSRTTTLLMQVVVLDELDLWLGEFFQANLIMNANCHSMIWHNEKPPTNRSIDRSWSLASP